MKSASARRDVRFDGHKTSVNLEDAFWDEVQVIAEKQGMTAPRLVATINSNRTSNNLSSEIRLFVLEHYIAQAPRSRRSAKQMHKTKRGRPANRAA
jgi:predicted DNA-binding ribbon-helix-helix protein